MLTFTGIVQIISIEKSSYFGSGPFKKYYCLAKVIACESMSPIYDGKSPFDIYYIKFISSSEHELISSIIPGAVVFIEKGDLLSSFRKAPSPGGRVFWNTILQVKDIYYKLLGNAPLGPDYTDHLDRTGSNRLKNK